MLFALEAVNNYYKNGKTMSILIFFFYFASIPVAVSSQQQALRVNIVFFFFFLFPCSVFLLVRTFSFSLYNCFRIKQSGPIVDFHSFKVAIKELEDKTQLKTLRLKLNCHSHFCSLEYI